MKILTGVFEWVPSISPEFTQRIEITTADGTSKTTLSQGTQEFVAKFPAFTNYHCKVVTISPEGLEKESQVLDGSVGDLETPQPATGLSFRRLSVDDVPEEPPAPITG